MSTVALQRSNCPFAFPLAAHNVRSKSHLLFPLSCSLGPQWIALRKLNPQTGNPYPFRFSLCKKTNFGVRFFLAHTPLINAEEIVCIYVHTHVLIYIYIYKTFSQPQHFKMEEQGKMKRPKTVIINNYHVVVNVAMAGRGIFIPPPRRDPLPPPVSRQRLLQKGIVFGHRAPIDLYFLILMCWFVQDTRSTMKLLSLRYSPYKSAPFQTWSLKGNWFQIWKTTSYFLFWGCTFSVAMPLWGREAVGMMASLYIQHLYILYIYT